ncbi:unnamed protein product [Toxocara canis]|uniref:Uncharacterized protein n=1 Tax=Toxocara canis TaxID=6265 RepID=A0A183UNH9_TOXCA|nr:unnamed protein product [Toxocara canis]
MVPDYTSDDSAGVKSYVGHVSADEKTETGSMEEASGESIADARSRVMKDRILRAVIQWSFRVAKFRTSRADSPTLLWILLRRTAEH